MTSYKQFLEKEEEKESIDRGKAMWDDYPAAAKKSAQQALDWRKEHGDEVKAMTPTGWQRAQQLAGGETLSTDVVSRMAQFNRHRKNAKVSDEHKDEPWKDNGAVAWAGWGGDAGVDWAIDKMKEIENKYKI